MPGAETKGSLLRKPDPKFEKLWDDLYRRSIELSAPGEETVEEKNEEASIDVGKVTLSEAVQVFPVQEMLF